MNIYVTPVILFLAFFIQTSFLAALTPMLPRPDLLLIFAVAIGVVTGVGRALVWVLAAGLLLDVAAGVPLGANVTALLPVALLTALRETDVVEGRLVMTLVLTLGGTFLYACIFLGILQATGSRVDWLASLAWIATPSAVLNTMLAPGAYWVVRRLAPSYQAQSGTFMRA